MGDLSNFGVDTSPEPPKCHRKVVVRSPTKDKLAGFICHERRRDMTVYTTVRGHGTYYRNGEGFAISESILDALAGRNVSRVFVHDARDGGLEDGNVYEFTLREYLYGEEGGQVPEAHREVPEDHQRYYPVSEARFTWCELGNDLYVSSFSHACDRIGNRSIDPEPSGGSLSSPTEYGGWSG